MPLGKARDTRKLTRKYPIAPLGICGYIYGYAP